MGSLTKEDIRIKLGLHSYDPSTQRGAGRTTEMLLHALEEAGKGNIVHIICHDFHFCGYLKGIATDYAKALKIDYKLLHFTPASTAYMNMAGSHYTKEEILIDHYVLENGMYEDYELKRLVDYAK